MDLTKTTIHVISEPSNDNPFIVIYKPRNLPSAPLIEGEYSALSQACKLFPEIQNVIGRKQVEHGLVHRIDTATEGLLLVATTDYSYNNFLDQQENGHFIKTYRALCEEKSNNLNDGFGYPPLKNDVKSIINDCSFVNNKQNLALYSYFRPFGIHNSEVRPVTDESGRAAKQKASKTMYCTNISLLKKNNSVIANCSLKKGYRHQVRCHLSWLGFPIIGDKVYNQNTTDNLFYFTADSLEFLHPITGEKLKYTITPDFA